MALERTLLIIKPDAVAKNLAGEIIRRVEAKGFRIKAAEKTTLSRLEAEEFYHVHRGREFYEGLVEFMISGPCIPLVVEGENVIQSLRELIGATDPARALPGTIRKQYAENTRRNCVHASDGPDSAREEIGFFFGARKLIDP